MKYFIIFILSFLLAYSMWHLPGFLTAGLLDSGQQYGFPFPISITGGFCLRDCSEYYPENIAKNLTVDFIFAFVVTFGVYKIPVLFRRK